MRAFMGTTFPFSSPATFKGATFAAVLPQVDGASVEAALAGIVTPGNPQAV
jgi:hypothetical protein